MHRIKIDDKILFAENGEKLSDILIKNNKKAEHPCGGRGVCKKCTVIVNGKVELSCQYKVTGDIEVALPEENEILSDTGTDETGAFSENMCFCLDIGTTTLALSLVSLDRKDVVKVITATNPQRSFGADVISRIDYCTKNGVFLLQNTLYDEVKKMIKETGAADVEKMYVSGNTTMLHIFAGVNPASMGVAPYTPVFLEKKVIKTDFINEAVLLPSISSFAGADIVAGLNFSEKPSGGKYNLLVDLGTNAEIILYSENKILCTSAAAGPCLEGANISCGMSAVSGAVSAYKKGKIEVIGNIQPKGICGTGLIDIISELLDEKVIDETGFMEDEEFQITENVFLTQRDVREFQLAKSAVYSGILSLIRKEGIAFGDIEKMYISGGFSANLNIDSAVRAGLIPDELKDKCETINNSSLLGTIKYSTEGNDLSHLTENAEYTDLSDDRYFSDLFIENMSF